MLNIMIYTLSCLITLGSVHLDFCHSLKISKSIAALSDEATIVLPTNVKELQAKHSLMEYIDVGTKVNVELGYNDELYTEFVGYIRHIEQNDTLRIRCEDEMYKLRNIKLENKVHKDISIVELVKQVAKGYEVLTSQADISEVVFTEYSIENSTAYDVLEKLKEDMPFIYIYFDDLAKLHMGLTYPEDQRSKKTYAYGDNFIKDRLSYRSHTKKDSFEVKLINHLAGGKKQVYTSGKGNGIREFHFKDKTTKELEILASKILKQLQSSAAGGYGGSLVGWGFPRTQLGHHLTYKNPKTPDKQGTYLIDKLDISFSHSGYRRTNELKYKIN